MKQPAYESPCGRVRLYLGDCAEVLPSIEERRFAITDPPYEVTMTGGPMIRTRPAYSRSAGFTDKGFDVGLLAQFENWVCFGALRQIPRLIEAAGERRWMLVTWNKPNPTPFCGNNYLPDVEYLLHAWTPGALFGNFADRSRWLLHFEKPGPGEHPNVKPVRLLGKMVRVATEPGAVVVDPFMGSGTTGIACLRNGRRFIGIERDPHWFADAKERIALELRQGELFPSPHASCDQAHLSIPL